MPTYEYRCPRGHLFERFFPRVNNRRHVRCPECGRQATRLISGGAGLVFKGSGFYITDYKRAGETKAAEKDSKPSDAKAPETPKKTGSGDQ